MFGNFSYAFHPPAIDFFYCCAKVPYLKISNYPKIWSNKGCYYIKSIVTYMHEGNITIDSSSQLLLLSSFFFLHLIVTQPLASRKVEERNRSRSHVKEMLFKLKFKTIYSKYFWPFFIFNLSRFWFNAKYSR